MPLWGMKGGVLFKKIILIILVTKEPMQRFKIIALSFRRKGTSGRRRIC